MKKHVALYGAFGLLMSVSAHADFQFELGAGYIDIDTDFGGGDGYLIGGTAYFESVDTSNGPLSEAAFLDKSSGLTVVYTDIEDVDDTFVTGRVVLDNDYILEAAYTDIDGDSIWGLGVGKYLTDASELVLSYTTADDSDVDALGLNYHALNDLSGNASLSYDLGVSYVDVPGDSGYGVNGGLTYYTSPEFGIGAFVEHDSTGDFDTNSYGVGVEYFFVENMAVSADYFTIDSDILGDIDTIALEFLARF